jgi:hypothetical protein
MKREVLSTRFSVNGAPTESQRIMSGSAARSRRSMWRIVLLALMLTLLTCVPALSQLGVKGEAGNPSPRTRKKSTAKPAPASSRNIRQPSPAAVARSVKTRRPARGQNSSRSVRNRSGAETQARTVRDAARPLPSNPLAKGNAAGIGSRYKVFVHEMHLGSVVVPVPEKVKSNPRLNPRNKIIEELSKYPGIEIVGSPREADLEVFYSFSSLVVEKQNILPPRSWSKDNLLRPDPLGNLRLNKYENRFIGAMYVVIPGTHPPEVVWKRFDSTTDSGNPYPAAKMARELIKEIKKARGER